MLKIRCETVQFPGRVLMRCHRCGGRNLFPDAAAVLIMTAGPITIVWDTVTGGVLHECKITEECETYTVSPRQAPR